MKRLTIPVISLLFAVLACGMPIMTVDPDNVNKTVFTYTYTQVPQTVNTTAVMTVTGSGGWLRIRPAAGDLSRSLGELKEGESVTVKIPAKETEYMGSWYELADGRGWVNARYLYK